MVTKVRLPTNLSKLNGVSSAIVVTAVIVGKMANAMEVTVVTDKQKGNWQQSSNSCNLPYPNVLLKVSKFTNSTLWSTLCGQFKEILS